MKRKSDDLKDKNLIKLNGIFSLFFVSILLFTSIGYAVFTQVINVGGNVSFGTQGEFYISNVSKLSSNNTSSDVPSWENSSVDFNLVFLKSEEENPTYTARYGITLKNDTFYERLISSFNFDFSILDEDNEPAGVLDYNIEGYEDGEVMQPLSEKTFYVNFTFTPTVDQDSYEVNGGGVVESNEKAFGNITSNSLTPSSGTIKNGALQQVVINLNSTYESDKEFNITVNSDKVTLVNAGGVDLSSFTIPAKSENQEYTFYIKAKDDAMFPDDNLTVSLSLTSAGLPTVSLGSINLEVDKYEEYVDTTPPIISNVVAVMSNEVGVVNLTWDGSDDYSGIKKYTVLVCDSDGNILQTLDAGTATSYEIHDLSNSTDATEYNFKVYGEDNDGNVASSTDISDATTSSGYCSASGTSSYQWVFSVTRNLTGVSFSGETTANIGTTYTATFTANNNYSLPDRITVRMGNTTLTQGSGYTYSSSNGRVSIPNVNGNITITVTGERGGICLIEGTKILMANGSYKNIEDIDYDDLMAVWSYDTGKLVFEYPIWIEVTNTAESYLKATFSDNTTLSTSGDHAVYNYDLSRFVSVEDSESYKVGSTIAKIENGKIKKVKITKLEIINKKVKLYHIISSAYFNIIANNVLTTDRNIMISNQYGFTKNITWPDNTRNTIINDKTKLYTYDDFKDIMPYYIYKGLRVNEGKFVVDSGYISFENLKIYLKMFPANPAFYKKVEENRNGKRLWMVTLSTDKFSSENKDKYKVEEGSIYTLPNNKKVKCYRNSVDNKCYHANDKIKVYSGIHFTIE